MSTLNRMANAKNQFQTTKRKVLCVCSAGLLRSPTAANVLHREHGYNTRAVGVSQEYALIPLDETHLYWADEVVCMEQAHADAIANFCVEADYNRVIDIIVLGVPDNYAWMDEELQELIKELYMEATL